MEHDLNGPLEPFAHPGLISFLPLVYVAWADGILSPSEIIEIREKFGGLEWVSEADQAVLASWIDPDG